MKPLGKELLLFIQDEVSELDGNLEYIHSCIKNKSQVEDAAFNSLFTLYTNIRAIIGPNLAELGVSSSLQSENVVLNTSWGNLRGAEYSIKNIRGLVSDFMRQILGFDSAPNDEKEKIILNLNNRSTELVDQIRMLREYHKAEVNPPQAPKSFLDKTGVPDYITPIYEKLDLILKKLESMSAPPLEPPSPPSYEGTVGELQEKRSWHQTVGDSNYGKPGQPARALAAYQSDLKFMKMLSGKGITFAHSGDTLGKVTDCGNFFWVSLAQNTEPYGSFQCTITDLDGKGARVYQKFIV